ncbi:hypothetical protein KIH41_16335 [Litoribacter ruber]|uniref:hypothetical protein n=1 Tax=Litoribacter ruber TaxID=702568 RepID=UPI001BD96A31|nr:hypothetical protein [Litoribacter ruber]MBT0812856.1 hypothetical protein [Litoribacter ruber]
MKKIIFYLPFAIDLNRFSASQIRPAKILKSFKDSGYEVFELTGNSCQRRIKYNQLRENLSNGVKYEFCYSESSTMPSLITDENHLPNSPLLDLGIFKLLKRNNISIGVFYRDIYWKFDSYKKNVGRLKYAYGTLFYNIDLWMYRKYVDVLFLPSLSMAEYLSPNLRCKVQTLPPACDCGSDEIENESISVLKTSKNQKLSLIYVGGVTPPHYDLGPLFFAASRNLQYTFKIICRKEEWDVAKKFYKLSSNVEIIHASGRSLEIEYKNSDLFLNLRNPDPYLNFSMPMKIFEAIQEEKPIITSNLFEIAKFVKENNIGWVIDGPNDLDVILTSLENDSDILKVTKENLRTTKAYNTWKMRVEKIQTLLAK